ncbi:MAG: tyrosine--tRNA ligase [Patescibacteria group bacterium]
MSSKEQLVDEILDRGIIVSILPDKKELRKRLISEKLRFYIGADATFNSLHLSHAKNYMLLEDFRKLGHEVIVLFGDFTARIGDPSGKTSTRQQLSREEVMKNTEDWLAQIKPLMNFTDKENPAKVMYNHDWLSKLTMEEVVNLASNVTVQQMLERDMFQKRIKDEKPIFLHEFLYPIMQGYDSVAMEVDVEMCGTDQIFNALVGRTLLKKLKNKDKFVMAVNLMENPVTGELMSKSRGTGIFLSFSGEEMYGAIMSQPDEMIKVFLVNNTRIPLKEIEELLKSENPRDAKMKTAWEIVKLIKGEEAANHAQENFVQKFQKREAPMDLAEISVGVSEEVLMNVLKKCLPKKSGSDLRRLLDQGAVKIEEDVKSDGQEKISIPTEGLVLKAGKKDWFRIVK